MFLERHAFLTNSRFRIGAAFLFVLVLGAMGTLGCGGKRSGLSEGQGQGETPSDDEDPFAGIGPDVAGPQQGAAAPAARLAIGDPAPPLTVGAWAQGDKVESFKADMVYVVEFWATWCGPCLQSMPHMSQLQKDYAGKARFVGITDEAASDVSAFLNKPQGPNGRKWRDVISYTLALDKGQQTNRDYLLAAGLDGIPQAFIVGKTGLIEWIGHPMAMDEALEKVVNDTWDREQILREFQLERKLAIAQKAVKPKVLAAHKAAKQASEAGDDALAGKKWDEGLAMIDQLLADIPNEVSSPRLMGIRDEIRQIKQFLLSESGRTSELNTFQTKLVEGSWDNPQVLDNLAWRIAKTHQQNGGSLDLALRAAKRSVELSGSKSPSALDTLARVYAERGEFPLAMEQQEKAVAAAASTPRLQEQLRRTLESYQQAVAEP